MNRMSLRCYELLLFSSFLVGYAPAQSSFAPVWRTVPWDSGGIAPNSATWSMVRTELDLDNDGKKEFLTVSAWSGSYFNTVYLYEFAAPNSYQIVWSYSFYPYSNDYSAVAVADLDSDGRKEILCLIDPYDSTYHGFYVFEWNGTDNGFPALPTTTWTLNLPGAFDEGGAIVAGDFDNDGRDEVAVSLQERYSTLKSRFMIFSLATSFTFESPVWNIEFNDTTTFAYAGYGLEVTDLDRDGRKEIIADGWERFHLAIFENTGVANSYVRAANVSIDTTIDFSNMGFVEANYDNNGTNELYIGTATGRFFVLTNPGNVSLITASSLTLLHQYNPFKGIAGVSRGDVDRNGIPELYLAGSYHEAVFQWQYVSGAVTNPLSYQRATVFQDDTTDQHTTGSDQGWFRPSRAAVGDFDADGRSDMVIASASLAADKPVLIVIEETTTDVQQLNSTPKQLELRQNFPNPFNPTTTLEFTIPNRVSGSGHLTHVLLKVFDVAGREVANLIDGELESGDYRILWDASTHASGIYYCRLTANSTSVVRKMTFAK